MHGAGEGATNSWGAVSEAAEVRNQLHGSFSVIRVPFPGAL